MQASDHWSPPGGVLGSLVAEARERVEALRPKAMELERAARRRARASSFRNALASGRSVQIVAEVKRRSPSGGDIAPTIDARARAQAYARGGAAAVSVLTQFAAFGGALQDLDAAASAGVPLLRKDFIVDRLQILESAAHGASAVLLIARALPPEQLYALHAEATALGLDALVEVHTETELAGAVAAGYPIIGVNNRDLETLTVDVGVSDRLIPLVPDYAVAVFESGVSSRDDVVRAAGLGADAVLVGSFLSSHADPAQAVRDLCGVARRGHRAS